MKIKVFLKSGFSINHRECYINTIDVNINQNIINIVKELIIKTYDEVYLKFPDLIYSTFFNHNNCYEFIFINEYNTKIDFFNNTDIFIHRNEINLFIENKINQLKSLDEKEKLDKEIQEILKNEKIKLEENKEKRKNKI